MFEDDEKYLEHSQIITKEWFAIAKLIQDMPNANVLFMSCRVDGMDHMVVLKLNYKYAPVMVEEEGVMRISTRQMVPSKAQGVDEAIIVNIETNQVFIIEKRFMIDGKMGYYLNEQYLKGTPKMTDREKMRIMNKAVSHIDEQYHVNEKEASVLIKQALTDCLLNQTEVKPMQIASQILQKDYGAQEECLDMMKDLGIREDDVVTNVDSVEKMAKCKIVTDTDIQLVLDVQDYMDEINIKKVKNEDGTMSIILSNIHEVIVK